ncbi:MAG: PD40 domain-containing protein [Thermoflexales bacterium]|nr:PD40 domain-containing protein [Thermoflexales bacterium]
MVNTVRFVLLVGLIASLAAPLAPCPAQAAAPGDTRPVTERELVRNGGFDQDKTAWATNPIGTHAGNGYGKDGVGAGMQIWPEFSDSYGYIFQELHLPSQLTAAALALDYCFVLGSGSPTLGYFRARLSTPSSTLATLVDVGAAGYPGETWQATGSLALGASDLSALNGARAGGQHVYLVIELYAQSLYVNVDNVSFKVSGSQDYPDWGGSIAYVGLDEAGYAKTVKRVDPDGANSQTLWTYPGASSSTNHIYDVAWKPDGSELAFSSDHEMAYSAFHSDAYGVKPDGSGLRRISNPPSKAELEAGGYSYGTVTGKVYNNYGSVTVFQVYVEGAADAVSVNVGGWHDEVSFSVPNVADLGVGLQYVVFTWSKADSGVCKEYAAAVVDAVAGQTVDAGTLTFGGTCGKYNGESLSWKRDGSELSLDVITPRRFQAAGQAIGADLFNAPSLAGKQAWSPVDDRVLYHYWSTDAGTRGIYLTTVGGGYGTRLVNDGGAVWVSLAWLPDGQGFVFALDRNLYQYELASSQVVTLATLYNEYVSNPSVSPDGRYVAFERQSTGTPLQYELWILDRTNPVAL